MVLKISTQKKWLSIIFIFVTVVIIGITTLVTFFEKNRYQQKYLSSNGVTFQEMGSNNSIKKPNTYSLETHLIFLASAVLGTGFFVLLITLVLSQYLFKKSLLPFDEVFNQLSELTTAKTGDELKNKFNGAQFDHRDDDLKQVIKLKQELHNIREKVIFTWNQLEFNQSDLELKMEKRTKKLNELVYELAHQKEERKEIESRLLNVQKLEAIGTLAGGIAHEFNNLFMAITGYASLIQRQSEPGHPNAVKAEKIRNLVNNGSISIKQLLGFAKGGKYSPTQLNINEVIRVNLEMFQRSRKDLELVINYTEDIWNIHADRSQMDHTIMNLLLNASENMPDNGKVFIETNNIVLEKKKVGMDKIVSGKFVNFSIKDEGNGIKREHIRRVFDPFFTTKPLSAGTGLGLASVYGIVDNHDGFTTVESVHGKGSTFSVFLPALK
jgi:signal transduction histidine kinase